MGRVAALYPETGPGVYVPVGQQAVTDLDNAFSTLAGLARINAVAAAAVAAAAPMRLFRDYTLTASWVLPAGLRGLTMLGTITAGAGGFALLDVSACPGLEMYLKLVGSGETTTVAATRGVFAGGDGSHYGSGPSDLRIKSGSSFKNFPNRPIDFHGCDRPVIEDGVHIDGCWGGVLLGGCRDFSIGRMIIEDSALRWPANSLQTPIYIESTADSGYPTSLNGHLGDPQIRNIPGAQAFLAHSIKGLTGRLTTDQTALGFTATAFNATDTIADIDVVVDATVITPWAVTAAAWAGGQATLTMGAAQSSDGSGLMFAAGQPVTLAGFTPAAWNGSWTVASVVGTGAGATVVLTMAANPGAATVLGVAAFTLGTPSGTSMCWSIQGLSTNHATNCRITGKFRNGNAVSAQGQGSNFDNWGAGHVGWVDGFTEGLSEYDQAWGSCLNIINPCVDINVGAGDEMRNIQATSGGSAFGVQVLANGVGTTGRVGTFDASGAKFPLFVNGSCPALSVNHINGRNIRAGGNLVSGGSNLPAIAYVSIGQYRMLVGSGAPTDAAILAATGLTAINGDLYWRIDGTQSLMTYLRTGGAWVTLGTGFTMNNGTVIATGTGAGLSIGGAANQPVGFHGAAAAQAARAGQLTDSSGGTSGGSTIAAVTDVASAANAIATLAARLNAVESIIHNKGISA